ncbi:MAG TPA: penicillin-binding protein 2 [bacterium]|nr:penicillin-binding protein 2 [bacterium]
MVWRKSFSHTRSREKIAGQGRIKFLSIFFIFIAVLLVLRLFKVQILMGDFYAAAAVDQHELHRRFVPERGSIYVAENVNGQEVLFPLVANQDLYMLYAIPREIIDPEATANKLFELFGLPEDINMEQAKSELFADLAPTLDPVLAQEIKDKRLADWLEAQKTLEIDRLKNIFSKVDDPYEPLRHRINEETKEIIESWGIKGLQFQQEVWRFYSEQGMGGHIFGFWGFQGDTRQGSYGLEGYFDEILTGQFGEIFSERDAWGNIITIGSHSLREKVDGSDLILTIDRAIQYKVCQAIHQAVDYFKAQSGAVIVLEPKTGAVLAMCGAPDFNPAEYNQVSDVRVYNNPAIFSAYEPGSIFKVITLAAALDSNSVTPSTVFEDTGSVKIGSDIIKNYDDKIYGSQTMTQALEKSINTGMIFAMRKTTPKVFKKYVEDFDFGRLTGITLDTEAAGDISNLDRRGEIYPATASFGQGITVTPLQVVKAVAAIANGGKLMKPYLVEKIANNQGEMQIIQPEEIRQVISSKTAAVLGAMMVSVVENGHGQPAKVAGYRVAGKTGTAQVSKANGRGYSEEVNTSFVGFAPFNNPRFAMIVVINQPGWGKEATLTAAPVFGEIAKFILQYYNVPYDNK